jgi:hypothetical protein
VIARLQAGLAELSRGQERLERMQKQQAAIWAASGVLLAADVPPALLAAMEAGGEAELEVGATRMAVAVGGPGDPREVWAWLAEAPGKVAHCPATGLRKVAMPAGLAAVVIKSAGQPAVYVASDALNRCAQKEAVHRAAHARRGWLAGAGAAAAGGAAAGHSALKTFAWIGGTVLAGGTAAAIAIAVVPSSAPMHPVQSTTPTAVTATVPHTHRRKPRTCTPRTPRKNAPAGKALTSSSLPASLPGDVTGTVTGTVTRLAPVLAHVLHTRVSVDATLPVTGKVHAQVKVKPVPQVCVQTGLLGTCVGGKAAA